MAVERKEDVVGVCVRLQGIAIEEEERQYTFWRISVFRIRHH